MNAVTTIDQAFKAPASGVFAGADAGDDLSGGITGGYGIIRYRGKVWAIHYRDIEQQLMRPDGDGPMGSIDIVILKANPALSKTWYENGWDENSNSPPDCASANGVTPDQGVPKRQSVTCANCPRNAWGTAPNGGKGKACGDHRRLAVVPTNDLDNTIFGGPMLLRCPAASLQDLATFDSKYKAAGYPYFSMGIKVSFDPQESFPKLVFTAVRPLNDDEARKVVALRASDEVARVLGGHTPQTQPTAIAAPQQEQLFTEAPNNAPVAAAVAQQPAQQVQQPVQQAQPQAQQAPRQAPTQGGFGGAPVQPAPQQPVQQAQPQAQPQPQVQQPAQQRPSQTMTGFGGTVAATPAGNASQVNQPQPVAAAQAQQPVNVTPPVDPAGFDASLDSRLAALLGGNS